MFNPFKLYCKLSNCTTTVINFFGHFVVLAIRYYLFTVFFYSGWLKTKSWSSTLALFEYEYNVAWLPVPPPYRDQVPFEITQMPYEWAAYLGTGAEIALPVLVLIGLGGRIPALAFFLFNYVALASYDFLWTPEGLNGLHQHFIWGTLIGFVLFYGHGKISLDGLFKLKCRNYKY